MKFTNLIELTEYFKNEKTCIKYFKNIIWKNGSFCPKCGTVNKVYEFKDGKTLKCGECKEKFSIKTGTIFEGSNLPLKKWFIAIYLVGRHSKGISSVQLSKDIGCTQKTAWFVLQRIRDIKKSGFLKLNNDVELDETYIGGKEKNKHKHKKIEGTQGRSTKTKFAVVGAIERKGNIVAKVVKKVNTKTLQQIIFNHITIGSNIHTDEFKAYESVNSFYNHKKVNHGSGEYVSGNCHTNSIESFWALFKRGFIGVYHQMSKKHLQRYVDEFTFRFNNRELTLEAFFDKILTNAVNKRLKYKELIC